MKKKWLAYVLTCAMAASLLPATVYAEDAQTMQMAEDFEADFVGEEGDFEGDFAENQKNTEENQENTEENPEEDTENQENTEKEENAGEVEAEEPEENADEPEAGEEIELLTLEEDEPTAVAEGHDISESGITLTEDDCTGNCDGHTITMQTGATTENTISVASGTHTITLQDVNISTSGCAFSIASGANVTLILEGENTLTSGDDNAGLQVPSGATLTIECGTHHEDCAGGEGCGSLTATGGEDGAGIGGGDQDAGGTIKITGGTVNAIGAGSGAGIGGGWNGSGGNITITGGNVTAQGSAGGAGIGGVNRGSGGEINITGGNVTAQGDTGGAGIGGGNGGSGGEINITGGNVTAQGDTGGAGIGGGNGGSGGKITITGGTVNAIGAEYGAGIGGGNKGAGGKITITGGTVTANGGSYGAGIGGGSDGDGGTIEISGGNVTATGVSGGAGIGGGYQGAGGEINITGGNVTAKGSTGGAGIGGGNGGSGGEITITGGTVTATGGYGGAGIGGGDDGGAGGEINITGGNVTAKGQMGGAGIGGGNGGATGDFSTGTNGTAWIVAKNIADHDDTEDWSGVIFQENSGQVYGNQTLEQDAKVESNQTLTVPAGATLTIPKDVTLTVDGTILNNGRTLNYGTIIGTVTGNQPISFYTITFNANGGTVSPATAETDVNATVTLPTPIRSGYRFLGWFTAATGGEAVTANTVFDKDTEVYAQWKRRSSGSGVTDTRQTLTFDANGGTKVESVKRYPGTLLDLSEFETTREGYRFTGWYTDEDLTKRVSELILRDDTKLYAGWERITEPDEPDEPDTPDEPEFENPFRDVRAGDWFYDAVLTAAENGWMSGTSADLFSPNATLTRGMIVTILYRADGAPAVDTVAPFTDVTSGQYYSAAVAWAAENGIVSGFDAQTFAPNENVTREQLAAILYRYAQYADMDVSDTEGMAIREFTDASEISPWAETALRYCLNAGIISGRDDGTLDPKGTATRAEAASMLVRFLEN